VDIATSATSSFAVGREGEFFAWGEINKQVRPHLVESLQKEKIVAVESGLYSTRFSFYGRLS